MREGSFEQHGQDSRGRWILTLRLIESSRLLCALNDGHWGSVVALAPWPAPEGQPALPESVRQALATLGSRELTLQLECALDAWPWERELHAAADLDVVPRFLTDLPSAPAEAAAEDLPWVVGATPDRPVLELIGRATWRQRPLVVLDAGGHADTVRTLEASLRNHWREPLRLSQALGFALAQMGLPRSACRLYGDGPPARPDDEQERRPVTALSIDVVASTSLVLAGDEAYAQRLQAYHALCREVIVSLQGSIDEPQGDDGLMAYFGHPHAVERSAARALDAAWQLSRGVPELGLAVRIGVASGAVAVRARQAFGGDVHLAARLRERAAPGQVLVAGSTFERLGSGLPLVHQPLGQPLKDYPHVTQAYRLVGPALLSTAARPPSAAPFTGRRHELGRLAAAWQAARSGRPQWLALQGEPGIGKTRLLQEFASTLAADGCACLCVAGQLPWRHSPFAALLHGLRRLWSLPAGDDEAAIHARLTRTPAPRLVAEGSLATLERLLASEGTPTPAASESHRWQEVLLEALTALAASSPLCVLVDDAQWLDPSSLDLLRRLRESVTTGALAVVSAQRSESSRGGALLGGTILALQGLPDDDARDLVAALGGHLPEQVRGHVLRRAEGVPLFLEESLRMLTEGHAGERTADVPPTLEDVLAVRLEALGPDRPLAQLMSVLGRECSLSSLQQLLAQDDPFVERVRRHGSLPSLLASGLVHEMSEPAAGLRFKHALIRDAAYGTIWEHDRRRLHGLCAALLEGSDEARRRPEQLAHHLHRAGNAAAARRAWLAAAQLAASRHAHRETLELAQRALDLDPAEPDAIERARSAMQLHLLRASAAIALDGYGSDSVESAYQAAEAAAAPLPDTGHAVRIRLGLEACYVMRGDLARAEALARDAVGGTAWSQEPRLALQARWALANVQFHIGHWRDALDGFDECLANYTTSMHRRSGVQDPAVMCLGYSSWIHFELGHADEALHRIERMLQLAGQLQHPFSTGVALGFAASITRLCGDSDAAWPFAAQAVEVCERGGFTVWLAHAWMARGQLRADRGDIVGGDEDMARGYALWIGGGARISCATYLVTRAEILLRQARTDEAAAALAEAQAVADQIGEHYYDAERLRLSGLCAWQVGDLARAAALLQQGLSLAQADAKPGLALRCALSLGALDAAGARFEVALQRLDGVLATLGAHARSRDLRWAHEAHACWRRRQAFASKPATPWEPE